MNKSDSIAKRSKKEDACLPHDLLVKRIVENTDGYYFEYEIEDMLENLVDTLLMLLSEQDKPVKIKNLGKFKVNRLNPRVMKSNLKKFNQELVVEIPEKYTIGFTPNRGFKAKLDSAVKKKQAVDL